MASRQELHSAAPQSGADVEQFVEEMQCLDPLLDVRWDYKAIMTKRGGYDAEGKILHPVYEGRWEIIHADTSVATAPWRNWTRICHVTTPIEANGVLAMEADGPYAPLGPWLIDFLRRADQANVANAKALRAHLDRMNDAADAAVIAAGAAGEEEALGRMYHRGTTAGGGVSQFHPVGAISFGKGYKTP